MRAPALAAWFAADYIHGDRFAALADIRIDTDSGAIPGEVLEAGRIVYCMTDRVAELFRMMERRRRPCILITHNADQGVDAALLALRPACVRHWYAQNAMVEDPAVTPIPIGLERPAASGGRSSPEAFRTAAARATGVTNLAYLSHSDWTNRWERMPVRWSLCWRDWVTARSRPVPFAQYLEEMARHRSVVSPRGNGVDCHRTWEALYLGVVPLVGDGPAMRVFARLFPIAVFDRLTTLTRVGVEREIGRVLDEASVGWQERLRFSWWERQIVGMGESLGVG